MGGVGKFWFRHIKFLPLVEHLDFWTQINLGDSSVAEKCLGKSTQGKCLALENRGP